eukprot:TRINITY_DN823_c0_g1_i1.p1 TRINITY_DN823_c0_g1~~TRINITY_DN823_c0_g1_i1.p1  ORF type:complete len:399 (-),score=88.10 TRINITY_DN823_c0_g1_i1:298-1494(-)
MVQVAIRTISKEEFKLDVPETATVKDVKEKIRELKPGYDASLQKLICTGKILSDDQLVFSQCGLTPQGYLVLMLSKPKPGQAYTATAIAVAAAPAVSAPAPAVAPAPAPAAQAVAAPAAARAAGAGAAEELAQESAPGGGAAGAPLTGDDLTSAVAAHTTAPSQDTIRRLCDMGFPEDQVRAALQAAFNNLEVAANYLMTGLPDFAAPDFDAHQPNIETSGVGGTVGIVPADILSGPMGNTLGDADDMEAAQGFEGGANPLAALRYHPQFLELRELVQSNPAALPEIIQGIGEQSPELLNMINAHPQAFVQLMNSTGDDLGIEGDLEGVLGDEEGQQQETMDAGGSDQAPTAALTAEDNAAVDQLMAIVPNMSRQRVVEAYLSCDKNMEYAMNMLFDG